MDNTKEYVAGIALVYRLCAKQSPEAKALRRKIYATGTIPQYVFHGKTNEDTVHGVNEALQTLETLKLKKPDVTELLQMLRPMNEPECDLSRLEALKSVASAKPKPTGGKSNVRTRKPEAADKPRTGD